MTGKDIKTICVGAVLIVLIAGGGVLMKKAMTHKPADIKAMDGDEAALRYPYQQLPDREKELYTALYRGILEHAETVNLPGTYSEEEYRAVYLMLTMQEPELFYLSNTYETAQMMQEVKMYYTNTAEEAEKMTQQLNTVADSIVSTVSPVMTDAQKLLQIHDQIAQRCMYGNGSHTYDAYGCLVNGMAECEGYAKAFTLVARRAGLNVMTISGTSEGTPHAWNIAEIDGAYYNIDVTWDDDSHFKEHVVHNCFAVPDSMFGDHEAEDMHFQPPVCDGREADYFRNRSLILSDPTQLTVNLRTWVGQYDDGMTEFRCTDKTAFDDAMHQLQYDKATMETVYDKTGTYKMKVLSDDKRLVIVILT